MRFVFVSKLKTCWSNKVWRDRWFNKTKTFKTSQTNNKVKSFLIVVISHIHFIYISIYHALLVTFSRYFNSIHLQFKKLPQGFLWKGHLYSVACHRQVLPRCIEAYRADTTFNLWWYQAMGSGTPQLRVEGWGGVILGGSCKWNMSFLTGGGGGWYLMYRKTCFGWMIS